MRLQVTTLSAVTARARLALRAGVPAAFSSRSVPRAAPTLALAWALASALSACSDAPPAPERPAAAALATHTVATDGADGFRDWDGTVEAVREAVLSAQTSGRVTAVEADVNDRVAAGAVLVRLTMVEQRAGLDAARAQLRAAEASAAEAERQYRRYASLAQDQYVSGAQLDQARSARDAAAAARDAARAQLAAAGQGADYTTVRAPYAGIVSRRDVEPGETVGPGHPLLTLYAPDALRIELSLPQSEAEAVRARPQATVRLDDGRSVAATGVVVYPSADPRSHSVGVRVTLSTLDDPPAPGTTATVRLPASASRAALRIPAGAIVRRGELTGVYVVQDGRPRLRQLRLGDVDGDSATVLSGLKPGETIATDPLAALAAIQAQRKAAAETRDE